MIPVSLRSTVSGGKMTQPCNKISKAFSLNSGEFENMIGKSVNCRSQELLGPSGFKKLFSIFAWLRFWSMYTMLSRASEMIPEN